VVLVANHPFGAVEGLALGVLLRRLRPDSKLLANQLLSSFPRLRDLFIFVNPFDTPEARRENVRGLRDALEHLRGGGLLGVFPSGEVSHYDLGARRIIEGPWRPHLGGLIRRTGATVAPLYFCGTNSRTFHLAGLVHPRLRTAMLFRELLNKRNHKVGMHVGAPLRPDEVARFEHDADLIEYLRLRSYNLVGRGAPGARRRRPKRRPTPEAVAPPVPAADLARDIAALPPEALLCEARDLQVFAVEADQMPHLMPELGRLRESAFRGVGEGTGQSMDLDEFDRWYVHLILWRPAHNEMVGAYRLGPTDRVRDHRELYVSTLFHFSEALLARLGHAVELGRSFIRPEYQMKMAPMRTLWSGIGQYVARNSRYRYMFGPVSISERYRPASRALISSYLLASPFRSEWADLVRPKRPFNARRSLSRDVSERLHRIASIDDLNRLVTDIEPDRKGVPPLLRQYLKLGAKVLAFNVDPAFNNCLDGLCVWDIAEVDQRSVRHYVTAQEVESYKAHHTAPLGGRGQEQV
jgi:putative hemolysin